MSIWLWFFASVIFIIGGAMCAIIFIYLKERIQTKKLIKKMPSIKEITGMDKVEDIDEKEVVEQDEREYAHKLRQYERLRKTAIDGGGKQSQGSLNFSKQTPGHEGRSNVPIVPNNGNGVNSKSADRPKRKIKLDRPTDI